MQSQGDVEKARCYAIGEVTEYRNIVASNEVTRLTRSRIGTLHWAAICEDVYSRQIVDHLCSPITRAVFKLNLFCKLSTKYCCYLFDQVEADINRAQSEAVISKILQRMDRGMIEISENRRAHVMPIMHECICSVANIFSSLTLTRSDKWYYDLCYMTLAMGPDGGYYLGGAMESEERRRKVEGPLRHEQRLFQGLCEGRVFNHG
ncbi:hypothetical protein V8E54_008050 [Elaphomyces granulatus]|jgi:hypothetical protein